jgi:hypothetical protein
MGVAFLFNIMQNLQGYFIGNCFDFPRWLRDQGIFNYSDQVQYISQITGQLPYVVQSWGMQFNLMPDIFLGMTLGYLMAVQGQPQQQYGYLQNSSNMMNSMTQILNTRY